MRVSFQSFFLLGAALLLVGQGCVSVGSNQSAQTTGPAGMFVSTDRGESWNSVSLHPQAEGVQNISGSSVYRLIEDPQDPRAMYWGTRGEGLFFTYNDGREWQRPEQTLNTGFIYSISVHPEDKCTIYATNGVQIFRSNDCSRTWAEVYRETSNNRIQSIAVGKEAPHYLYMAKSGGDFLRSEDNGVSWRVTRRMGTRLIDVFVDPHTDGKVYVATQNAGMLRSDDQGITWKRLNAGLERLSGSMEYKRFFLHPEVPNLLYYVSTYGIHKSVDGGDSWTQLGLIHPPGSAQILGFTVNPQNVNELYYTATINTQSTFYKSIDGGKNWITKRLPSGQVPTALRVHPENEDWIYVGFTIPPKS